MALERHHATLFVDPAVSEPLEAMRQRWDPEMARQIAAHVTLVYPWEVDDPTTIAGLITRVAPRIAPFRLRLGELTHDTDEDGGGCGFAVVDVEGGYARLRSHLPFDVPDRRVAPHVTVVHPRTSDLGTAAWAVLRGASADVEFWVHEVAITAWDGDRWPTAARVRLAG